LEGCAKYGDEYSRKRNAAGDASDARGPIRAVLNAASGAIPFAGGILSAAASAWSEAEQEKKNAFFEHWLKMLQDEMAEKA